MTGPFDGGREDGGGRDDGRDEVGRAPRIPAPRAAADDLTPPPPAPDAPQLPHGVLKSLLGAWALTACSTEETAAVEAHLTECAPCAEEALRLRDAVGLLHSERDLDLDPLLRSRVLENCLGRRPARIPVPAWAGPYDAETARLDALLRDIGESEWHASVRLKWFEGERQVSRSTTVAGVIGHLLAVDGLVATALDLDDPLGARDPDAPQDPASRTEAYWSAARQPATPCVRGRWRDQAHALVRTVSFAGAGVGDLIGAVRDVLAAPPGRPAGPGLRVLGARGGHRVRRGLPVRAAGGAHLHGMIDLAARLLPAALAERRRAGLAGPPRALVEAGAPGRSLHLEVEGSGGGHWYIALDSPAAVGSPDQEVAQVALDGVEFCQLVAGRISPEEAAAGQDGDREAIKDVLFAAASLSRL
ncbi:zf-HC2 domain-containing protein [Streptomyces coeruleoprunus]